jgi:hypothetical protein
MNGYDPVLPEDAYTGRPIAEYDAEADRINQAALDGEYDNCPTCGWPRDCGIPELDECDGQAICPTCNGSGNGEARVVFIFEGERIPLSPPCPTCHGTGRR